MSLAVVALIVITLLLLLLFWRGREKKREMVKKEKNSGEEEENDDSDYSSYQVDIESFRCQHRKISFLLPKERLGGAEHNPVHRKDRRG